MDIEQRIKDLHSDDLERLCRVLNFALSGAEIGETGAFQLVADIEVLAITENDNRGSQSWIPDEQLAGYIA